MLSSQYLMFDHFSIPNQVFILTHGCRVPGWTPWECLWGPTTVTDQHNSDFFCSGSFNLAHLLRRAAPLSVMHSVFIRCDDRFLFDLPDWIIPCWYSQGLRSAYGGGSSRRLVREQWRVTKLTCWCHIVSVRTMRWLSFPSISWNRGASCISPSHLLQSALIFSSIPRELLHVYVFVLQLSWPHLLKFAACLPSRKNAIYTHAWCVTLQRGSLTDDE